MPGLRRGSFTLKVNKNWEPGSNTLAYYPLDSTNTINDLSGNNRNLTNSGMTFGTYQGVSCVYGTSKQQYLRYSSEISGLKTISLYTNWSGSHADYWSSASIILQMSSNPTIRFFKTSYSASDDSSVLQVLDGGQNISINKIVNQRFHIVVVFDTTTKLYINGQLAAEGSTPDISGGELYIGRYVGTGSTVDGYLGGISNIIFESKARTENEIIRYYNYTKSEYGL